MFFFSLSFHFLLYNFFSFSYCFIIVFFEYEILFWGHYIKKNYQNLYCIIKKYYFHLKQGWIIASNCYYYYFLLFNCFVWDSYFVPFMKKLSLCWNLMTVLQWCHIKNENKIFVNEFHTRYCVILYFKKIILICFVFNVKIMGSIFSIEAYQLLCEFESTQSWTRKFNLIILCWK